MENKLTDRFEFIYKQAPRRLFTVTLLTIFLAEAAIMILIHSLLNMSGWIIVFLDATLISIFVLPSLYYFMFQPLLHEFEKQQKAQKTIEVYEDIVKNIQFGLYIFRLENPDDDNSLILQYANPSSEDITGIPVNDIIGKKINNIFPNLKNRGIPKIYADVIRNGKSVTIDEFRYSDNRVMQTVFSIRIFPLPGSMAGVAFEDISERKGIEIALKENEKKYRQLFREMSSGFALHEIICDETTQKPIDYRFLEVNQSFEKLTGLKAENIIGKTVREVLPKIEDDWIERYGKVALYGNSIKFEDYIKELDRHYEVNSYSPMKGQFATIFNDITNKKKLEDFAIRAQRLETAGRIAGQVAHDFNNLMGPLVAYPEFIKQDLPENHPSIPLLDDMEKSAKRMSEINQELLTLGRRGHYSQKPLNLNDVIEQALTHLNCPEKIKITKLLDTNLSMVKGGASQIFRAFSNVIINSIDSIRESGEIIIKTENFYLEESEKFGQIPKGNYVKITIADNGCGIDQEIIPRIMDPFFSTKTSDKKRGSGLGLSVLHAVLEDHNAYYDIESDLGKGTAFYLYFPMSDEKKENTGNDLPLGGIEKVLVVDDDDNQRVLTERLLSKLGYKTKTATSGEEAVEIVGGYDPDLLVLDMIMPPGIDGTETYKRILQIKPAQKAIIVSGFAESQRVEEAQQLGAKEFVRKPLTIKSLALAVRKELDTPSAVIEKQTV